jgi:hypothetical protein
VNRPSDATLSCLIGCLFAVAWLASYFAYH